MIGTGRQCRRAGTEDATSRAMRNCRWNRKPCGSVRLALARETCRASQQRGGGGAPCGMPTKRKREEGCSLKELSIRTRRVENSAALLFSLRPVAMTGIVTPLIVSVPLCPRTAAALNLAGAETSSPFRLVVRFGQNMSALIRDECGSQALFLAVTAAVRVRVVKKTTRAGGPCNTYRMQAFLIFRLDELRRETLWKSLPARF